MSAPVKRWRIGFRSGYDESLHTLFDSGEMVKAADYDALAASVDRLTSDKARLASELAAEQESNTFLNNLHTVDAERIKALEAALMALANKCHGELGCPGYKLAYDLGLCPPAETPAKPQNSQELFMAQLRESYLGSEIDSDPRIGAAWWGWQAARGELSKETPDV